MSVRSLPCPRHTCNCRPQGSARLVQLGMHYPRAVHVRAEWVQQPEGRRRGGWALKTKQERILM